MASSATPAPRIGARSHPSMFVDLRTVRRLVAGCLLALMPILVRSVMARADAARLGHEQDQADRTYKVRRGLDNVLADLTSAGTRQRGLPITGRDDYPGPLIAAPKAVADDIDTSATPTAEDLVQQRIAQPRPLVRHESTDMQATVDPRRSEGLRARQSVLLQSKGKAVRGQIRSLTTSVQAGEGSLLDDRRADSASAMQTTRTTLMVAGLVELLIMVGPAPVIVRSIGGPLRRAVRVLQEPADRRFDRRRRLTTLNEVRDMSGALDAPIDGLAGGMREIAPAQSSSGRSEELTGTSRRLPSSAEESATPACVVSAAEEASASKQAVTAGAGEAGARIREVAQSSARQAGDIASLVGVRGAPGAGACMARAADRATMTAASTLTARPVPAIVYAAARSRAHGPTTPLWHAVQLHRPVGAVDGACEVTVCGSLVRVSAGQRWPLAARDVCPTCATLAH